MIINKIMNWEHNKNNYFVDHIGIKFNFLRYSVKRDNYGFKRKFKVYDTENY